MGEPMFNPVFGAGQTGGVSGGQKRIGNAGGGVEQLISFGGGAPDVLAFNSGVAVAAPRGPEGYNTRNLIQLAVANDPHGESLSEGTLAFLQNPPDQFPDLLD